MTYDAWDHGDETEAGLVPLYVLVNGRTSPRNTHLDLATQVIALPAGRTRLEPAYREVVNLCVTWISIAEIGALLHRPLTLTKVMVDVLVDQNILGVGMPAQRTVADRDLLEAVLAGLERL